MQMLAMCNMRIKYGLTRPDSSALQAKDTAFWAGHYGGKFTAPELCFAAPDDRQLTRDKENAVMILSRVCSG